MPINRFGVLKKKNRPPSEGIVYKNTRYLSIYALISLGELLLILLVIMILVVIYIKRRDIFDKLEDIKNKIFN